MTSKTKNRGMSDSKRVRGKKKSAAPHALSSAAASTSVQKTAPRVASVSSLCWDTTGGVAGEDTEEKSQDRQKLVVLCCFNCLLLS